MLYRGRLLADSCTRPVPSGDAWASGLSRLQLAILSAFCPFAAASFMMPDAQRPFLWRLPLLLDVVHGRCCSLLLAPPASEPCWYGLRLSPKCVFRVTLSPASVGLFSYCYPATENTPWMVEWSKAGLFSCLLALWYATSNAPWRDSIPCQRQAKAVSLCLAGSKAWVMGSLQYFWSIPFFITIFKYPYFMWKKIPVYIFISGMLLVINIR